MNISLIGPTGAGKGTYARELCPRFGLVHVATGDLLRLALEVGTPSGQLARTYMERGDLVPDEIVVAMIEDWVELRGADGILFDGFPRTVEQATFIDDLLGASDRELDLVVYLEAPEEVLRERLAGRLTCEVCQSTFHETMRPPREPGVCDVCGGDLFRRADDNPAIVHSRLQTFRRTIGPVVRHYRERRRLAVVDASGPIEEVVETIAALLETIAVGKTPRPEELARTEVVGPPATAPAEARATADVVLLGGPGSGKGTQATYLNQTLGVPHISTGELFRENVREETELGRLARSYMDHGELVPDDVTEAMVRERVARPDAAGGFILDGFPRTRAQAEALDEILAEMGRRLGAAVYIDVSDDEIVNRLASRGRQDDAPETVRTRLRAFQRHNGPLLDYYRAAGLLREINGEGTPEAVAERVRDAVDSATRR